MNYVEQTPAERRAEIAALNRRNRIDPVSVPIPAGGPVKLTALTPEQIDALTESLKAPGGLFASPSIPVRYCDAFATGISLTFVNDGPAQVNPALSVDYQALAAFRADVIEELQREIAALKLDRDAKMDAARGLRDELVKEREARRVSDQIVAAYAFPAKAPTKGEVLANALARCDSVTTAYGR